MTKYDAGLSAIFQALSDPTRRDMLARLADGPHSAGDLAGPTGLALPTVMRHLSVLEQAGLIHTEKTGRTRICRVQPQAMTAAADWLAQQRLMWAAATDRLQALLAEMEDEDGLRPDNRP